jgi:hypothetical protein
MEGELLDKCRKGTKLVLPEYQKGMCWTNSLSVTVAAIGAHAVVHRGKRAWSPIPSKLGLEV